jgi:hypothetical protein
MNQQTTSGSAALLATLLATLVGLLRVCWPLRDALADCEAIFRAQEQLGDVGGDAPGLVAGDPMTGTAPSNAVYWREAPATTTR